MSGIIADAKRQNESCLASRLGSRMLWETAGVGNIGVILLADADLEYGAKIAF